MATSRDLAMTDRRRDWGKNRSSWEQQEQEQGQEAPALRYAISFCDASGLPHHTSGNIRLAMKL
jgi:hypothetical protein